MLYSGAVLSDENRILYLRWVVQCMKDLVSGRVWLDVHEWTCGWTCVSGRVGGHVWVDVCGWTCMSGHVWVDIDGWMCGWVWVGGRGCVFIWRVMFVKSTL